VSSSNRRHAGTVQRSEATAEWRHWRKVMCCGIYSSRQ